MREEAISIVQEARGMWSAFWRSHDDEGADDEVEERQCVAEIRDALQQRVDEVGRRDVVAAICADADRTGSLMVSLIALVFVWRDFVQADWIAVARLVSPHPPQLYQFLWLVHDLLGVDPLDFLRERELIPDSRLRALESVAPAVIVLSASAETGLASKLRLHGVDLQSVRRRAGLSRAGHTD